MSSLALKSVSQVSKTWKLKNGADWPREPSGPSASVCRAPTWCARCPSGPPPESGENAVEEIRADIVGLVRPH